ncbi:hypothetical protein J2Y41_001552 [Arthrobacter sp. 1088]|uniref:hypothetical protein n=1 Tax=Arthrobacter sp. 1088 TaxID=2817768 RepID=UPI0028563765|nr:hypothetical protein [Arthrobacter sp. 1088]MDR6685994.1 hypothetical protein [Arthrobacter sp. 1088]
MTELSVSRRISDGGLLRHVVPLPVLGHPFVLLSMALDCVLWRAVKPGFPLLRARVEELAKGAGTVLELPHGNRTLPFTALNKLRIGYP